MSADEELYEPETAARPAPAPRTRVSPLGANALVLLGLGMAATGGVFAASQHVSWTLYRIARQVAAYGVAFDLVCATGLAIFAAGVVGRGVARLSRQTDRFADEQLDLELVLDQIVADVADVRAGVDSLAMSQSEPVIAEELESGLASQNEKDALFRMAASLDQLSGRLSKRVSTDLAALKSELHRLAESVEHVAVRVEGLEAAPSATGTAAFAEAAAPFAEPTAPEPEPQPAALEEPAASPFEIVEAPAEEAEDDAFVVDLDAAETEKIELLERLEEEVEGRKSGSAPSADDLYAPPPALPGKPEQNAPTKSYESSLDRLLPEDNVRDAIDESR